MQQRRPRLGDILDDYCPRERRVTNHAVVAIVDDDVKQTRCTTCDGGARIPAGQDAERRAAPSRQAALTTSAGRRRQAGARAAPARGPNRTPRRPTSPRWCPTCPTVADAASRRLHRRRPRSPTRRWRSTAQSGSVRARRRRRAIDPREDDGPVHRRLIRATFPRPEGHVPERREPEFTIRQPGGRGAAAKWTATASATGATAAATSATASQGGGSGNFGGAPRTAAASAADGQRGGRGPGGPRGDNRQGGGGQNRGPAPRRRRRAQGRPLARSVLSS